MRIENEKMPRDEKIFSLLQREPKLTHVNIRKI